MNHARIQRIAKIRRDIDNGTYDERLGIEAATDKIVAGFGLPEDSVDPNGQTGSRSSEGLIVNAARKFLSLFPKDVDHRIPPYFPGNSSELDELTSPSAGPRSDGRGSVSTGGKP